MKLFAKVIQKIRCFFRGHLITHGLRMYKRGPTGEESDKIWGHYFWCGVCDKHWLILDHQYKN